MARPSTRHSIRQNPFIAALIVAVFAVGIGTSVVAITLYHAKAGNPIWWKNDVLYRVMLDSRPVPHDVEAGRHPEYPPFTLIYRDAVALGVRVIGGVDAGTARRGYPTRRGDSRSLATPLSLRMRTQERSLIFPILSIHNLIQFIVTY